MVDALTHVQHAMRGRLDTAERQLEELQRGLVGLRLLRCNDVVEAYFELRSGTGEQFVIDVGQDREAKSRFQLMQCINCVGPRLPGRERIGQGSSFLGSRSKTQFRSQLPNDG